MQTGEWGWTLRARMTKPARIRLSLIVARARGGVIGHAGKMPWHIPSELAHFKRTTLGKPVLMGRKTWDSLYVQPLPGRDNLVLSRNARFEAPGARTFTGFHAMLDHGRACALAASAPEMVVIGGAALYKLALPLADRVYLTEIPMDVPGDAWFEDLAPQYWQMVQETPVPAAKGDQSHYTIRIFDRKNLSV